MLNVTANSESTREKTYTHDVKTMNIYVPKPCQTKAKKGTREPSPELTDSLCCMCGQMQAGKRYCTIGRVHPTMWGGGGQEEMWEEGAEEEGMGAGKERQNYLVEDSIWKAKLSPFSFTPIYFSLCFYGSWGFNSPTVHIAFSSSPLSLHLHVVSACT